MGVVELAVPTLVAGGLVWIASAVSWMALPHHHGEYRALPDEAALREALRAQRLARGQYIFPHLPRWEEAETEAGREKFEQGPVGFLTIMPNRLPSISRHMLLTLLHYLIVSSGIAWAASLMLPPGAPYAAVFRPIAVMALLAHGAGVIPEAIWYGKPWGNTLRALLDAALFALLTAGAFAGLWPESNA
jgi:hypothetical protein